MRLVKCGTCGKEFETNIPNKRFCCQRCNDIARNKRDAIPREKKCKYCGKNFMGSRGASTCKECISLLNSKAGYISHQKMSVELRNKLSKKASIRMKNRRENATNIEKERRNTAKVEGREKWMSEKSDEERKEMIDKLHIGHKRRLNTAPEEEINKAKEKQIKSRKNTYNKKTDEEKKEWHKKHGESHSKRYQELKKSFTKEDIERISKEHSFYMKKDAQKRSEETGYAYPCQYPHVRESAQAHSKTNQEWGYIFKKHGIEYGVEFSLGGYSYDFICGDTLVEINPYAYHNSTRAPKGATPKEKDYHFKKAMFALAKGYKFIAVWDWDDEEKIIGLLKNKKTIGARGCKIKEINYDAADIFLRENHLQGNTKKNKNTIFVGLYYGGEIVMCMSFGKPRYNAKYQYELLRLCTKIGIIVVGGAEKIFKYFLEKYNPKSIISYCDKSKFSGNIYTKLGFTPVGVGAPSKHRRNIKCVPNGCPKHITNNQLIQRGFDQLLGKYFGVYGRNTSNEELMKQNGYVEIYDCGQATYIRQK